MVQTPAFCLSLIVSFRLAWWSDLEAPVHGSFATVSLPQGRCGYDAVVLSGPLGSIKRYTITGHLPFISHYWDCEIKYIHAASLYIYISLYRYI